MSDPTLQFPGPEANDADDVVSAVETAGALWKKGDPQEAIRWLRRAAEAAEEAGNDMRAVALARAAADLTTAGAETVKLPVPATESRRPKLPEAPPLAKRSSTAATGKPVMSDPTQDLPAPPPRRHGAAAPAPSAKTSAVAPVSTPSTARPPAPSQRPPSAAPRSSSRNESEVTTPLAQLAVMAKTDGAPLPSGSRSTRTIGLKALRIAVTRTNGDASLSVRVLDDHDPVPDGAQSAILVATEAAIDQLTRRR